MLPLRSAQRASGAHAAMMTNVHSSSSSGGGGGGDGRFDLVQPALCFSLPVPPRIVYVSVFCLLGYSHVHVARVALVHWV